MKEKRRIHATCVKQDVVGITTTKHGKTIGGVKTAATFFSPWQTFATGQNRSKETYISLLLALEWWLFKKVSAA